MAELATGGGESAIDGASVSSFLYKFILYMRYNLNGEIIKIIFESKLLFTIIHSDLKWNSDKS